MKLRLIARAGCAVLLTSIAATPYPPTLAAAAQARHHYEITGGLTPTADSSVGAPTHFGASAPRIAQVGDRFELSARLVTTPDGCAADTIFSDGFDP